MALMRCPDCGNEVSDNAEFCIKCGYSFKKQSKKRFWEGMIPLSSTIIGYLIFAVIPIGMWFIIPLILFNVGFFTSKKSYNKVVHIITLLLCAIGIILCFVALLGLITLLQKNRFR